MSRGKELLKHLPPVRGRLEPDRELADLTWFRVGGAADILFAPADEDDLAQFLQNTDLNIPVTVIGVGSNLLVRDGGVRGVVIRLGRGFGQLAVEPDYRVRTGAAVPDVKVARFALDNVIGGLTFLRGIPGTIGGALRMNAGAYGGETRDVLIEARAVDRKGMLHMLSVDDMGYGYRHSSVPADYIFTQALLQGSPGEKDQIAAEMAQITASREASQPVKSRTGGSTFKNPDDHKSWQLIDAAGMRGARRGGAMVSEKHCNFLINDGMATAADLEDLGEEVRERVKQNSGIELQWEIRRIGER